MHRLSRATPPALPREHFTQTIDVSRLIRKRRGKKFFQLTADSFVAQRGRRELLTVLGIVQTFSIYRESIGNYVGEATVEFPDSFAMVYNFGQTDPAV